MPSGATPSACCSATALFAHALRLSTNFSNNEICRIVSEASAEVCSGEIIQTQRRFDLNFSIADYYKVIEMKTAALFAASCELGAFISEASPEIIGTLKTFGSKLGTAYQIYDDILDIDGDEATVGKTLAPTSRKANSRSPCCCCSNPATRKTGIAFAS